MANYFFDSSGLVKYYLQEKGARWVETIVQPESGHILYVARITEIESNSAFARVIREGKLSPEAGQETRERLANEFLKRFIVADLTGAIAQTAIDLLYQHPLRGYDAVQLASALTVNEWLMTKQEESVVFVSADKRLLAVAQAVGLPIEDPNAYP